ISKFLGKSFVVIATLGHIKDLPKNSLGVDLSTLEPAFVWLPNKKKLIGKIITLAKDASAIYIATDPDREGEAIANSIREVLKNVKKPTFRVSLYELTPKAIYKALQNPGEINKSLVNAQLARRVLDRLVGYLLSPKASKALKLKGASVGRVQSPAIRLIVEREKKIQTFKPKTSYYIKAVFQDFEATLKYRFEKPENAKVFIEKFKDLPFEVLKIQSWQESISPPKAFKTATLQQVASQKLSISVSTVQKLAQMLYETGYITYPRTDSTRINYEKALEIQKHIKKLYGDKYLGTIYQEKMSAHECIRPVSIRKKPPEGILGELYRLILNTTLASLSSPAVVKKSKIYLRPIDQSQEFIASFQELDFDGFLRLLGETIESKPMPEIKEGDILIPLELKIFSVNTSPPERLTEATLIKALEKLGIGRPSTFATIVSTILERGYIKKQGKSLIPTQEAFDLIDFLEENYSMVIDFEYTKKMEELLEKIEKENINWKQVVKELFQEIIKLDSL
ncbi:MAG: type IA DNA topoisomerase, partial [Aquificaceae bacterium]